MKGGRFQADRRICDCARDIRGIRKFGTRGFRSSGFRAIRDPGDNASGVRNFAKPRFQYRLRPFRAGFWPDVVSGIRGQGRPLGAEVSGDFLSRIGRFRAGRRICDFSGAPKIRRSAFRDFGNLKRGAQSRGAACFDVAVGCCGGGFGKKRREKCGGPGRPAGAGISGAVCPRVAGQRRFQIPDEQPEFRGARASVSRFSGPGGRPSGLLPCPPQFRRDYWGSHTSQISTNPKNSSDLGTCASGWVACMRSRDNQLAESDFGR